jgi:hypothetical protein
MSGWLPWALYFAITNFGEPTAAIAAGLAAALNATVFTEMSGLNVKLIGWTTLTFFTMGGVSAESWNSDSSIFRGLGNS